MVEKMHPIIKGILQFIPRWLVQFHICHWLSDNSICSTECMLKAPLIMFLQTDHSKTLQMKDILWKQKSQFELLQKGDSNTKSFRSSSTDTLKLPVGYISKYLASIHFEEVRCCKNYEQLNPVIWMMIFVLYSQANHWRK